jgi:hypothetical protein
VPAPQHLQGSQPSCKSREEVARQVGFKRTKRSTKYLEAKARVDVRLSLVVLKPAV